MTHSQFHTGGGSAQGKKGFSIPMESSEKRGVYYALLVLVMVLWGSLYVANKFVMTVVPNWTLLFLRYLCAAVCLTVVQRFRDPKKAAKPMKIARGDYKYIILLGLGGYAISVGMQQLGTKLSGASLASLINSMNPIFIVVFAIVLLHEKVTVRKIICILCAVCGAGLIVGGNLGGGHLVGIIFSILSVLTWAFTSVSMRSFTQRYDALSVTTYGIYVGTIATLPVGVWELVRTPGVNLLAPSILLPLLYIGVICTTAGHTLWNYCLSKVEASTCSLFYPIQPLASMGLGILILHEKITPLFLAGTALILFGVLYSSLSDHKANQ